MCGLAGKRKLEQALEAAGAAWSARLEGVEQERQQAVARAQAAEEQLGALQVGVQPVINRQYEYTMMGCTKTQIASQLQRPMISE